MSKEHVNIIETMKELIANPINRIKLDDFVATHTKLFIENTSLERFPIQGSNIQSEEFVDRLHRYEEAVRDLQQIVILLARWGDREDLLLLEKIFQRTTEMDRGSSGLVDWQNLSWYPTLILMYSSGIAAIASKKFEALKIAVDTEIVTAKDSTERISLGLKTISTLSHLQTSFQVLPGFEQRYTARSDYLAGLLRGPLEGLLFLGNSYDYFFDEFEVYLALASAHASPHGWGPVGRFGWKYNYNEESNPFYLILAEAQKSGQDWRAIRVGLFDGSSDIFQQVHKKFKEDYFDRARSRMT